jgi:hypothetical protein
MGQNDVPPPPHDPNPFVPPGVPHAQGMGAGPHVASAMIEGLAVDAAALAAAAKSPQVRELGSLIADLAPIVGAAKGAQELVTGENLVTGEPVGWGSRLTGLIPLVGAIGRFGKGCGELAVRGAGKLLGAAQREERVAEALRVTVRSSHGDLSSATLHVLDARDAVDAARNGVTAAERVGVHAEGVEKAGEGLEKIDAAHKILDATPKILSPDTAPPDPDPGSDVSYPDPDPGSVSYPDHGGVTPDDDHGGVTPDDDHGGVTPDDDHGGVTPDDDHGGVTPDDDHGGVTPDDDHGGVSPTPDDHHGVTPDADHGGVSPTPDDHHGVTPGADHGGVSPTPDDHHGVTPDADHSQAFDQGPADSYGGDAGQGGGQGGGGSSGDAGGGDG